MSLLLAVVVSGKHEESKAASRFTCHSTPEGVARLN